VTDKYHCARAGENATWAKELSSIRGFFDIFLAAPRIRRSDAFLAAERSALGCFFRQPLAPEGATLTGKRGLTAQRGQAEGAAVAMNAEMCARSKSVTGSRSRKM
jgi:hypothetical protein